LGFPIWNKPNQQYSPVCGRLNRSAVIDTRLMNSFSGIALNLGSPSNKTVVTRYRIHLEDRQLAPGTVNVRLAAVRRLAYEAADTGLHRCVHCCGWQQTLHAWIIPNIGEKLVADVSNGVLRELVGKMVAAGLSPKTIVNYSQVVKLVVASAVNADGEQIYPRKWNHDFIGIPLVQKEKQHRPTVTETELGEILSSVSGRYRILFTLLAGTGLRIGEALGLKGSDFSPDCRAIHVQRSVWRGREQSPKTSNAVRVVDVPEVLAQTLRAHVREGYIFSASTGRPLESRNVLRVLHATGKRIGFHAFRRYRAAVLRKARAPEDLITLWLGHARTLTDLYATQLREDVIHRREWCERAGLGFSIVTLLHSDSIAPALARVA
jgi:integrase